MVFNVLLNMQEKNIFMYLANYKIASYKHIS